MSVSLSVPSPSIPRSPASEFLVTTMVSGAYALPVCLAIVRVLWAQSVPWAPSASPLLSLASLVSPFYSWSLIRVYAPPPPGDITK